MAITVYKQRPDGMIESYDLRYGEVGPHSEQAAGADLYATQAEAVAAAKSALQLQIDELNVKIDALQERIDELNQRYP